MCPVACVEPPLLPPSPPPPSPRITASTSVASSDVRASFEKWDWMSVRRAGCSWEGGGAGGVGGVGGVVWKGGRETEGGVRSGGGRGGKMWVRAMAALVQKGMPETERGGLVNAGRVRRVRGTEDGGGEAAPVVLPYRPDLIHGAAFRHGLVDEIAAARHCRDDLQEVVLAVDGGVHRGEKRRVGEWGGREVARSRGERTLAGGRLCEL